MESDKLGRPITLLLRGFLQKTMKLKINRVKKTLKHPVSWLIGLLVVMLVVAGWQYRQVIQEVVILGGENI